MKEYHISEFHLKFPFGFLTFLFSTPISTPSSKPLSEMEITFHLTLQRHLPVPVEQGIKDQHSVYDDLVSQPSSPHLTVLCGIRYYFHL